nr:immunoglobulin heavy chain junction region [Mus musculus]
CTKDGSRYWYFDVW